MKTKILAIILTAGTLFSACKEDSDEPQLFNNTTWYPVRTVGEYQIWQGDKISYDLPVGADGLAILYYERNGEQDSLLFGFPVYEFYMKKGKNVYNANYIYGGETPFVMKGREYYIEGDYIFLEQPSFSSNSSTSSLTNFTPKSLTIFTSDSIRIGDAFYKKR